jgi:hypothetical protein
MLLEPITNKFGLRIYYGLWEIFIGFGSFIIFFGIFIKYYFDSLEESLMNGYIKSSVSFYKPLINILNQYGLFSKLIKEYLEKDNFYKTMAIEDEHIKNHNAKYDNLLLKIIAYILVGFLIILFLPVLIGLIPFREINWSYIGLSFLLHIVLIIIFEIVLLYYIIPINNPIELHTLFDNIGI